jgi:hypothetical protein
MAMRGRIDRGDCDLVLDAFAMLRQYNAKASIEARLPEADWEDVDVQFLKEATDFYRARASPPIRRFIPAHKYEILPRFLSHVNGQRSCQGVGFDKDF